MSVLATSLGNLHATWFNCENRMFCTNRSVFKTFWVSLEHFMTIHYLPHLYLSHTHHVTLRNLHFCFISTSNLQKKGMGFLSLTTYFMFWALFSCFCELGFWFVIFVVLDMGWDLVCCVWVFGFGWSCFLNAKYGCYHVLVSLFEFVNWSVLVGYSHTHDNMSHCQLLFVWVYCDILCLWVWLVQNGWA